MFARGLAVTSLFALVGIAQAGVDIQFVATPNQATYTPGQVVQVDVNLVQTPAGSAHSLRLVQFDFAAATNDAFPAIGLVSTHPTAMGGINFWDFSSKAGCTGTPANCGAGHFVDDEFVGPGILGPDLLAIAYYFTDPANLTENLAAQLSLPASTPVPTPFAGGRTRRPVPHQA